MTDDFNPYEILRVSVDATPEQIKAAWRQLVRLHHPDKGGNRERYEEVIRANDILSDPDRRSRFDRTGEIDPTSPENLRAGSINFIVEYFKQCIEQTIDKGADVCTIDLVQLGIRYMKKNVIDLRAQQQRPRKLVAALERTVKRLKKKQNLDEHSILHLALNKQIINYYRMIEQIEEQIDLMDVSLGIMMDYEFKPDQIMALGYAQGTM